MASFRPTNRLFPPRFIHFCLSLIFLFGGWRVCVQATDSSITDLTDAEKQALEDKQDRLDDIKAKIKAYQKIVALKEKQGAALSDQLESLEAQAATLQLQIDSNAQTLTELEGSIKQLTERVREKQRTIITQKHLLSQLLQTYYAERMTLAQLPLASALADGNVLQEQDWSSETGEKLRDLLSSLQELQASLEVEQATLENKHQAADTLRLQLSQRSDYLESVKDDKSELLTKTAAEAKKYTALVDDLEKERESIENEIENIETGKIDDLDLKDVPKFSHGLLAYPVKQITISQGYGKTTFTRWYKFHNGVDFSVPSGSSVFAAADGKVVTIGNNGRYAYGRYIAIDHGNGLVTMYGHLSSYKVKVGEKVKRGEVIALSGSTGYSTGPHVHFTVFATKSYDVVASKNVKSVTDIPVGATIDPRKYLP